MSARLLTPVLASVSLASCLGCASPQSRWNAAMTRNADAWRVICEAAPHQGGQAIDAREQRAMDVVNGWQYSVEEIDRIQCREEMKRKGLAR